MWTSGRPFLREMPPTAIEFNIFTHWRRLVNVTLCCPLITLPKNIQPVAPILSHRKASPLMPRQVIHGVHQACRLWVDTEENILYNS